jgi:hypothetical protein
LGSEFQQANFYYQFPVSQRPRNHFPSSSGLPTLLHLPPHKTGRESRSVIISTVSACSCRKRLVLYPLY